MPTYEFRCEKCLNEFSRVMSMAERSEGKIACPACQGRKVVPQYSTFYAKTSRKS